MNVLNMRGKKQTFTYGNDSLLPNYFKNRRSLDTRKGRTINLWIAARETSKASTRREDQPAAGHGTRSPKPNGTTSPRHALRNATTKGKSSEEDHKRRSAIRTGATTEGTQETRWGHYRQRREPNCPPGIGTVPTTPRTSPTRQENFRVLTGKGANVDQEG